MHKSLRSVDIWCNDMSVVHSSTMYTCFPSDMPGPLRMGLHNLLVSLHLEAHANSRWVHGNIRCPSRVTLYACIQLTVQ